MIQLSDHSYLGNFTNEYFEPEVFVGKFTSIADRVWFAGHMNHASVIYKRSVANFPFKERWEIDYFDKSYSRGPITIGNDVWVGHDAFIHDGVTIHNGAIIGARANVTKNVPPYAIVGGNPAKLIKYRFTQEQIESLQKIRWWDWDVETIKVRIHDFKDIDTFITKYLPLVEAV